MFDGWTVVKDSYFGWMTLRPARGFPGYVRLVSFDDHEVYNVRADRVMVGGEAF
jgi:hypothetical protein